MNLPPLKIEFFSNEMKERNIFVINLFLLFNTLDSNLFFCVKIATSTPPQKKSPPLSQQPSSKNLRSCQALPHFLLKVC